MSDPSQPGVGTMVTVRLPAVDVEGVAIHTETSRKMS